tara:strand:- start:681 stop:1160 length:480 start_codon:yes stop_codon:yes gene_type:complete
MSKQLKVTIIISCIVLGLFGDQMAGMLDGMRNHPSSVTVLASEPSPELKESVKGIPVLITGSDAAVDKIQISDYFNQVANVIRDDPGFINNTQIVRRFNSTAGQINFAGQSLKDKYNGLGSAIDDLIKNAIGNENVELDKEKRDKLVNLLKAIAWTLRN